MKILLPLIICLFAFTASAQSDITWTELRANQKEIREQLYAKHDADIEKLLTAQKEQLAYLEKTTPTQDRVAEMLTKFTKERYDILKIMSDERMALLKEQSGERDRFIARQPASEKQTFRTAK